MAGKRAAAGNTLAYLGFVDSSGKLLGSSTTAPSNGSISPMLRLLGIQQAQAGIQEPEDVQIPGDDGSLGIITFDPQTTPSFIATFGAGDLDLDALLLAVTKFSVGDTDFVTLQPNDPGYLNACLILQSRALGKDDVDSGQALYEGQLFPLVQCVPLGRETFAGRQAAVYRVKITTQVGSHMPSGVTLTSALAGTDGSPAIEFKGKDPILMERITGNNSTTSFELSKKVARTTNITAYQGNGQALTHGSGITAAANDETLQFTAAPGAGVEVVVVYGFVP